MERPDFFELKNGEKVKLPFTDKEYNDRVSKLRTVMDKNNIDRYSQSFNSLNLFTVFFIIPLNAPFHPAWAQPIIFFL